MERRKIKQGNKVQDFRGWQERVVCTLAILNRVPFEQKPKTGRLSKAVSM